MDIRRNPKVAVMIEAGDDYADLRGVMIRGRCEILEDEGSVTAAFAARAGDKQMRRQSSRSAGQRAEATVRGDARLTLRSY